MKFEIEIRTLYLGLADQETLRLEGLGWLRSATTSRGRTFTVFSKAVDTRNAAFNEVAAAADVVGGSFVSSKIAEVIHHSTPTLPTAA